MKWKGLLLQLVAMFAALVRDSTMYNMQIAFSCSANEDGQASRGLVGTEACVK